MRAALKGISRNAAIADEWLVPVRAAIAELEGRCFADAGAARTWWETLNGLCSRQ
jgi:hypothetical protein